MITNIIKSGFKYVVDPKYRFLHNSNEKFYLVYKQEKVSENDLKLSELQIDYQTCFEVVFPVIYGKLKEEELDKLKVNFI